MVLERFRAMVDGLRGDPRFEVSTFVAGEPGAAADISAAEERLALRSGTLALWREADGLELDWSLRERPWDTGGRIVLPSVRALFPGVEEDRSVGLDLGGWDDVRLEPGGRVFTRFQDGDESTLPVDLPGYVDLLLLTRGFWGWQRALARDRPPLDPSRLSPAIASAVAILMARSPTPLPTLLRDAGGLEGYRLRHVLPELFPGVDPARILKHDYAERDQRLQERFEGSAQGIVRALLREGADFEYEGLPFHGQPHLFIATDAANMAKVDRALATVSEDWRGVTRNVDGEWGGTELSGLTVFPRRQR